MISTFCKVQLHGACAEWQRITPETVHLYPHWLELTFADPNDPCQCECGHPFINRIYVTFPEIPESEIFCRCGED